MGTRHGPRPARRGRRAGAGTARGRPRARGRGGGGRGEAGTAGGGLPGGGGRRAAAARLQEREAAAVELAGSQRGARDPRPPGMGAPAGQSSSGPAGARPRKAGVERLEEPAGPGEGPPVWREVGPGKAGQSRVFGGCLGAGSGPCRSPAWKLGSRRRDWIPSGTCWLRVSPQGRRPRLSLPSPPRVGFGPRGALEVARPEKFLPFPRRLREPVPGARELPGVYQETQPGGTDAAPCNPFTGLSQETKVGGLVESGGAGD